MKLYDQIFLADYDELSLHELGRERCQESKIVEYAIKDYDLFHYIFSGKGTFIYKGVTYNLKKGDIFYIKKGDTATYFPDKNDPWHYIWIGFKGNRVEGYLKRLHISTATPIFHDNKKNDLRPLFYELAEAYMKAKYLNIEVLSVFMRIIYQMTIIKNVDNEILETKDMHIRNAKQFIEHNFQFNIKVTDIASALGLSPNYLANIFKEQEESSPKQYLIYYRMLMASELLIETTLPIKEVAKQVGYKNALHFSQEFKRIKHVSPKNYRTRNRF